MGKGRYEWVDDCFSRWLREEAQRLRRAGEGSIGTKVVSERLHRDVIIPNQLHIPLPRPLRLKKIPPFRIK